MSARRFCALLLLAAVFSMHGVQCVVADAEAGHGLTSTAHAWTGVVAAAPSAGAALDVLDHGRSDAVQVIAGLASIAATPVGGLPSHGVTLWAVCLAVVLTGLVLLGAGLLIRRVPALVVRARAPSVLWHTGWSRLPRPPDLSALCLLRI